MWNCCSKKRPLGLGNSSSAVSILTLNLIKIDNLHYSVNIIFSNFYMQVEVSRGRGKPSVVVDKDEGLRMV